MHMHACAHVHAHVCVHTCMHACTCVHMCMQRACMYNACTCTHVHVCVRMCVHNMCTCTCIHMYTTCVHVEQNVLKLRDGPQKKKSHFNFFGGKKKPPRPRTIFLQPRAPREARRALTCPITYLGRRAAIFLLKRLVKVFCHQRHDPSLSFHFVRD